MVGDGGETITVLHVDDEPSFADMVATFLERTHDDITVVTAVSAEAGLERLESTPVDCIVSDHDMPGMDGLEFLKVVREAHPELPFLLFTGKGSEEIASDAISAGVTEYLQKESGTEQYTVLANRIERAVEEYRAKSALEESERMFSTLISNLPGMAYRCRNEPDWPMEYVSEGANGLTGYEPEAIRDGEVRWGADVVHPAEQDRLWEDVQRALDEREPFEVTYRIVTADGREKRVWEQGRGVYEDGELVALEGIILEIEENRPKTGDATRLETIREGMPVALVVLDPAANAVVTVNDAATSLFERSRRDLLGTPPSKLFPAAILDANPWIVDPTESDGLPEQLPTRIQTSRDTPVDVTVSATVARTQQGRVLQLFLQRHDQQRRDDR